MSSSLPVLGHVLCLWIWNILPLKWRHISCNNYLLPTIIMYYGYAFDIEIHKFCFIIHFTSKTINNLKFIYETEGLIWIKQHYSSNCDAKFCNKNLKIPFIFLNSYHHKYIGHEMLSWIRILLNALHQINLFLIKKTAQENKTKSRKIAFPQNFLYIAC